MSKFSNKNRIEVLADILFEDIDLLESYPSRVKKWEEKYNEYKERYGNDAYMYCKPYPLQGTSETHIRDVARLLRKELLRL